jgi:multidrug efflux pump subunit AcrA (membrane-fusion protein)
MRGAEGARDMTLIKLVPGGTRVKKGDVIAQIDAQALVDHLDDVKAGVEQAQAAIEQRRAELAVDWENLQQTLRQDKAALDKAKLDYGARETRTAIDQEILKLALDEAQESYKQDQANLAFKEISQKIDLHLLEIARDRQIKHRDRHVEDLKKFTFTAPMDGLAVIQTTFTRNGELSQIQLGDAVYSGQIFMKIVDTSKMQVETSANQTECNQLRIGMPARITLDAFPGLMLKGKIYSIGAMGVRGWRENYYIRNVPVRVVIDDQDPRLIPDLSAAVDIILAQRENALILPLEALHREGGKAVVYVKRGNRFERRTIQVGFQSFTHAEVLSGLTVGDEVALEPLAAEPAQTAK